MLRFFSFCVFSNEKFALYATLFNWWLSYKDPSFYFYDIRAFIGFAETVDSLTLTTLNWLSYTASTRIKVGFTFASFVASLVAALRIPNFFISWLTGFEILACPCNQFLKQEPGTSEEAEQFACTRFKAEYPIFSKVSSLPRFTLVVQVIVCDVTLKKI